MIEIGNVVTLDNGNEFLLLEEVNKDNRRFVYSVRVKENDEPTNEYIIFEALNSEDGEYLKDITDKALYDSLIEEFKNVISDKIISGEYNDMFNELEEDNN